MAIAKTKPDSAIQTNVLPIGNRMLALEPRYVFDAAIATELHQLTTLDAPLDHSAEVPESVAATIIAAGNERAAIVEQRGISLEAEFLRSIENFVDAHNLAPSNHEIAFIDSRLADLGTLVSAIPEGTRIVLIDGSRDGVVQMADALRGEDGITGVHIVSHGSAGQIELGSSTLNADTMATVYRAALESIGSHLSADADILVYGCNFAAGSQGVVAVDLLSTITGADVAGSEDNTGSAQRGGDWDLEKQLGSIEAGLIDAPEWDGILAPFQISVSSLPALTGVTGISPTGFGSGGVGMTGVWTNAGTVGGVAIDLVAQVISVTGGTQVSFWNQLDDPNVEL